MARLSIRIDLDGERAFGPGKARLLELIDDKGSIRSAAAAMNMSYRRAWLLLHDIEAVMGTPAIAAAAGGAHGGGTQLTKLGRTMLKRYRTIEVEAQKAVARELSALQRLSKKGRG